MMQSNGSPLGSPNPSDYWRKCTTCKSLIGFGKKYWVCSVSTCNRQRTGLVFCDIRCFDAHVPVLNHRDAGAFERRSPTQAEVLAQSAAATSPSVVSSTTSPKPHSEGIAPHAKAVVGARSGVSDADEILVVVSKVKEYIRAKSGMNTSDSVMDTLSAFVRKYSDRAIESAERSGRKTVQDRDF